MGKPDIENEGTSEIKLEKTESYHEITSSDIKKLESLSTTLVIIIIVSALINVIIKFVISDILAGIMAIIYAIIATSGILLISRIMINTAYTAKKNREALLKLTKALEEKNDKSIEEVQNYLNSEDISDIDVIHIEPIKSEDGDTIKCPICFADLPQGITQCPNCGLDFNDPQEALRYMTNRANANECPCCFANISPEDTECPNCGYKLK